MNLRFLLFVLPITLGLAACKSPSATPRYALAIVKPQRIEVTNRLDAHPVAEAEAFVKPFRAGVDSLRMPRVGESAMFMAPGRPESLLSNWVADVLVAQGRELGYEVQLGVCNIGGLRSSMPEGIVRRGDILAISPFENFFTILHMKGSDVLELCRNIAAVGGEGVSAGMRMVISADGQLVSAQLCGKAIDPDATYVIATLNYLADGNDQLTAFRNAVERKVTDIPIRDVLMNHLRQLDAKGEKATAKMEGRIVVE